MTCDSTVRWPQDLQVFRCTTCLTINDLNLYDEQRPGDTGVTQMPARKPMAISLDRTRKMIEHCLNEYFEYLLSLEPSEPDFGQIPSQPLSTDKLQVPTSLAPPRPAVRTRSPSNHSLNCGTAPSVPNNSQLIDGSDMQTAQRADAHLDRPDVGHDRSRNASGTGADAPPKDSSIAIFRSLESYIAGCCTGCTSFNISFFSVKPPATPDEKSNPAPGVRRQNSDSVTTPQLEVQDFISELDAKTLLLGDVVENGSWWTGSRTPRHNPSEPSRERSPERWRGVVNVKTPRINWLELAEWYQLIIHAGSDWHRKWNSLQPTTPGVRRERWQSITLGRLQQEIHQSQLHLQRSLLKAMENLLKRPRRPLKNPEDCRFLLMLLANPLLFTPPQHVSRPSQSSHSRNISKHNNAQASNTHPSPSKSAQPASRRSGGLGHHSGIIKRIMGLLANLSNELHQFLVSWISRFSDGHFQRLVDTVSSFVTYRLTRQQDRVIAESINPTAGLVPSFSDSGTRHASELHAALGVKPSKASNRQDGKPQVAIYSEDWQVKAAARVMAILFQANTGHVSRRRDLTISRDQRLQSAGLNAKYQAYSHGQIVPISTFYNTMLDHADLVADFEAWEVTKSKFTFCQYPFFFSIWAKIHILEHDARRQMEVKAREAFFDSILSRKAVSQFLVLRVRRDCLVEDSLKNVSEVVGSGSNDIKKGLRINFIGEEGIDAGGLRKEWFLSLVREIFDPNHGLFVYDEDSQYCYFNPYCFESSEQFFLVGVLLGLAIYNSTILDIALPPFVFKKLMASAPTTGDKLTSTPKVTASYTLEDLAEFRPILAKGLRQLLEYDGDVQETFCRDFVIETDRYGETIQTPLCPNGHRRPVTNANRREFVDSYIRYTLDTAVTRQYEPFKRGFFTVCAGNALSLFRPEEIELLVRGSDEPLDVTSLKAVATYENWPKTAGTTEEHAQIVWFWEFFQRVTPSDQRKVLSFITGSDRIPAMGATSLNIKLQLLRDKEAEEFGRETERFPIARTCFNTLGLYQYRSKEKLEAKLWTAVQESEGFGLK